MFDWNFEESNYLKNSTIIKNPSLLPYVVFPNIVNDEIENIITFCTVIGDRNVNPLQRYGALCMDLNLTDFFYSIIQERLTPNSHLVLLSTTGRVLIGTDGYLEFLQDTEKPNPLLHIYEYTTDFSNVLELCSYSNSQDLISKKIFNVVFHNNEKYKITCSDSIYSYLLYVSINRETDFTTSMHFYLQ